MLKRLNILMHLNIFFLCRALGLFFLSPLCTKDAVQINVPHLSLFLTSLDSVKNADKMAKIGTRQHFIDPLVDRLFAYCFINFHFT